MSTEPGQSVSVERQVEVRAPIEEVWERITDSTLISDWMEGEVEIRPVAGGQIIFRPPIGPQVWGTVEEVIECRRIQWSWRTDEGLPSLIEIELEETTPGSTLVEVRETLLPWTVSGPGPDQGWPTASARPGFFAAA